MAYEKPSMETVNRLAENIWNCKHLLRPLVRGFAASQRTGKVTCYLSHSPSDHSSNQIAALGEGVDLDFERVGSFHLTNVGEKLRRREGYSGRMAAYVRGGDGRHYALTCGHVLQGIPSTSQSADVLIQGNHHPAKFAVKSVFDFQPSGINLIDAGLAELHASTVPPQNHLPDGTQLPQVFADFAEDDEITHAIPGGKKGKITSIAATILVTFGSSEVTLNDMIIARSLDGLQFVQQGDSGSLFVRSSDSRPVGMLLGKAKSLDGAPSDLAIICPLERTLKQLSYVEGAQEHYPGPYTLL